MKKLHVIFLLIAISPLAFCASPELLLIAGKTSVIPKLFQQQVSEKNPISEYVEGTLMQGTALTYGTANGIPFPSKDGIGVVLTLQSMTNACTINTNYPRPDIGIEFDWSILTHATTTKSVVLKEDGFHFSKADTSASSEITIHSLNVSADGLFWRLKTRIARQRAWEQLMNTKAQNEWKAANRVATELNKLVDERTDKLLNDAQINYKKYVYEPLIENGLLGGRLFFATDNKWAAVKAESGEKTTPFSPSENESLKTLGTKGDIIFRINQQAIPRVAESFLAGLTINSKDLANLVNKVLPLPEPTEDITFEFADSRPLGVKFNDSKVVVNYRLNELKLGTLLEKNLEIAQLISIAKTTEGHPLLMFDRNIQVSRFEGEPISPEAAKAIQEALQRNLPTSPWDLAKISLVTGLPPLETNHIEAANGVFTLIMSPSQP